MSPFLSRRAALAGLSATAFATPVLAEDTPKPVSPPGAILGEGPLWSARDNRLYWVDIRGKILHALPLDGSPALSWPMPDMMCWIVEREQGGFLVGLLRTVYALTLEPFSLKSLLTIEGDKTGNRLNDAKVDARGRLWTGTMDLAFKDRMAALYRIDPDLSVHQMDTGYVCTNGPAFSKDGRVMYHNETHDGIIYAYDLAADGSVSGKRVFARFADGVGLPDGCTVDADDGLWVSHYGGGRASRYTPDGKLDFDVIIPARQSTSLTFAGPSLDRMFSTTAAQPPVAPDDKLAGTLFEWPKSLLRGHKGMPTNLFKG
ncbi:MAG TPA: SMP-30/gluconolactonase/LRE family protein [Asticcacaulis sp.]|nr:SMP-30/gluconolactonase/LRE family protein [Asticcacaulis sp.]